MGVTLSEHSFITMKEFNLLDEGDSSDLKNKFNMLCNAIVDIMEKFCGRPLKARSFSYDPESEDYNLQYSVFDPPPKATFWFPTYPINTLTEFTISDTEIIAATSYNSDDGYVLYKHSGKLVYSSGFDFGYSQNIKAIWNGGYTSDHQEYAQLQYIQYMLVKELWDKDPGEDKLVSEKIGTYQYQMIRPTELAKFLGVPAFVFNNLGRFKRIIVT